MRKPIELAMAPPVHVKAQPTQTPEIRIRTAIIKMMESKGWLCRIVHCNAFTEGFPDVYCAHPTIGQRWIEVKKPKGYRFTRAQLYWFPRFEAAGVRIWVLTDATETEYSTLFGPANWRKYLK